MNRSAIYIDGAYLDKVMDYDFNHTRIDFKKLVNELSHKSSLLRSYYYHCPPYVSNEPTPEEIDRLENKRRFFVALSKIPRFQPRLGRLGYRGKNSEGNPIFIQKAVDVMMAVDMVRMAATSRISNIIVVSGDTDFIPAIKAVKDMGVLTTLWLGRLSGMIELQESFDEWFHLADIIDRIKR